MASEGKFQLLVRLGFLARAVVYVLLGYLALQSRSAIEDGPKDVFAFVQDIPLGTPLLYLCTVGLLGYALFRLSSLVLDTEHAGSDGKGWAKRIGHGASGVGHLILAYTAFQFAQGGSGSGGSNAQDAASTVLSVDFGGVVLGLVGLAFMLGGAFQAYKGISGSFMDRISHAAPDATRWLGLAGYLARSVVFLIIGWSLARSGWFGSSDQVKSIGGAMSSLADDGLWFTLVASGMLIFGIFSSLLARYRVVPDL